ncbi:MAG: adenylate/guanylate cyclase domain-containing protein [Gordonia sp. (in: high G+C Gram-positive bacteria)]
MSDEKIKYTREEMADTLHVDPVLAERVWRAFGFPHDAEHQQQFSADDVAAVAAFAGKNQHLDPTTQLAAARAIGQSTARLAQWQADQIRTLAADPGTGLTTEQLVDALAHLQNLVWRRHLLSLLQADTSEAVDEEVVVGFADIVGYTSMSRRLPMVELEALLESFESGAHSIVSDHGGQIVKNIGDAVMFTVKSPAAAASIALELHALTSDGELPSLCIGLAMGHTLARIGDVFGEPVNIAARLASAARSDTTLVDENVAKALEDDEDLRIHSIPTLSVRGYRRLKAYALSARKRK